MSAREEILARVRAAVQTGDVPADRGFAVSGRLRKSPLGVVPEQASSAARARIGQFCEKLQAVSGTVTRVSSREELPGAIARELRERNLPAEIRAGGDPLFADLDWEAVELSHGTGRIVEPVTLSRAEFGMAEVGTLVLASGPDNPVTLTFLGETHFVVLQEADLMAGFEDMWAEFRRRGLDPRTVNMVTGPSRSADIGQVLQLGAHGPVALHVFLLA